MKYLWGVQAALQILELKFDHYQIVTHGKTKQEVEDIVEEKKKEVKSAYRKLALLHHPDKGGDALTFNKITEAYELLMGVEVVEKRMAAPVQQSGFHNANFTTTNANFTSGTNFTMNF